MTPTIRRHMRILFLGIHFRWIWGGGWLEESYGISSRPSRRHLDFGESADVWPGFDRSYFDPEQVGPARAQANSEINSAVERLEDSRRNLASAVDYNDSDCDLNHDPDGDFHRLSMRMASVAGILHKHSPNQVHLKSAIKQIGNLYTEVNDCIEKDEKSPVGYRGAFLTATANPLGESVSHLKSAKSLLTNRLETFQGNELPSLFDESGLSESRQ
nr:hypothetical protein L204_00844 [Cryptococcus depauperatus CBS 7855]